jgi:hypothetical protein
MSFGQEAPLCDGKRQDDDREDAPSSISSSMVNLMIEASNA